MLSIRLWRWYINVTITILDIFLRPVFYLKLDVSESGFRLRRQVELTQLGPTEAGDKDQLSVRPVWVGSTWRRRQNPVSETSCFK
jgi:hypothetical protein